MTDQEKPLLLLAILAGLLLFGLSIVVVHFAVKFW
jgi:hypothetical protein